MKRVNMLATILVFVTLAIYWQVRAHDFISFDDYAYVTHNSHVTTGLTRSNITWAFTTIHESNWHPLTWLSHMADCSLFGLKAGNHHLVNVLFHLINTLVLYFLMKRLTGAAWRSLLVSAAFALHPLHVESVAWVAERKDLLATLFWLMAIYAHAEFTHKRSLSHYLLCLSLFSLGLMSKPMIVTFPFLLLLLDYWPLGRFQQHNLATIKRLVLEKAPFFALSAVSCLITYYAQEKGGAVTTATPFVVRAGNALLTYVVYIRKVFWPVDLAPFYPFPETVNAWHVAGAASGLTAVTAVTIAMIRRHPYLATGWFWYLGTLVPVIGLVRVGSQGMADRYTYFPSIGLYIFIVWGTYTLVNNSKHAKTIAASFAVAALSALAAITYLQTGYWNNVENLFEHSLKVTGTNFYANNILWTARADARKEDHFAKGLKAAREGDLDPAIREFKEVLEIDPASTRARYNLGVAFQMQGDLSRAVEQYRKILEMNPNHAEALEKLHECREITAKGGKDSFRQ